MLSRLIVALSLLASAVPVLADPPTRVGRLAELAGEVYLSPLTAETDWRSVGLNYPVTDGDNVWVSPEGRAEIDFGAGQFRLAGDTNVHFAQLDERSFSAFVASGKAILRLRFMEREDTARLDSPHAMIDIRVPGLYRLEVAPDGYSTTLVVREGQAELRLADRIQPVSAGYTVILRGDASAPQADFRSGYTTDAFDGWSQARDGQYDAARATHYVSQDIPGWWELERYGFWQTFEPYGPVWFPRGLSVGWAPYRYGHWAWVHPWGWTWVDDAPWGFAPFHYGRWAWIGGRWGWCPGTWVGRPVYAPALVAWFGGTGWSFTISDGPAWGWVPLGWDDPFYPSYGYTALYWRKINRPFVPRLPDRPTHPPAKYSNLLVAGAVTAVAGSALAPHRPVHRNYVEVPPAALRTAKPVVDLPIAPAVPSAAVTPLPSNLPRPAGSVPPRPSSRGEPRPVPTPGGASPGAPTPSVTVPPAAAPAAPPPARAPSESGRSARPAQPATPPAPAPAPRVQPAPASPPPAQRTPAPPRRPSAPPDSRESPAAAPPPVQYRPPPSTPATPPAVQHRPAPPAPATPPAVQHRPPPPPAAAPPPVYYRPAPPAPPTPGSVPRSAPPTPPAPPAVEQPIVREPVRRDTQRDGRFYPSQGAPEAGVASPSSGDTGSVPRAPGGESARWPRGR